MGYTKQSVRAGDTIIVHKGYRTAKQAGMKRAKRENPTPEAMHKVNERNAIRRATIHLNANFRKGDYHLVLTYRKENRVPPTQARENMRKFIRALRTLYRKAGRKLKYLHTTEYKNDAIHHHLVVNYFDLREIAALWECGMVRPTVLYTTDLSRLASYLIKETAKTFRDPESANKQRYIPSKNLERPEPVREELTSKRWAKTPKAIAGYVLAKDEHGNAIVENGVSEVTGLPWQYYIMVAASMM